jgi:fatty-acyl-CoA synthase
MTRKTALGVLQLKEGCKLADVRKAFRRLALKHHPDVYDTVVVPTPHERWGQQVTALVRLREGVSPTEAALKDVAREHIAAYKLPKRFIFVDEIVRSPSGKADYRWARKTAVEALGL